MDDISIYKCEFYVEQVEQETSGTKSLIIFRKLNSIFDIIQTEGTGWILFVFIGRRPWLVFSLDISTLLMTIFFEFLLYIVLIGLCKFLVGLSLELVIFLWVSFVFCIYWPL